MKEGLTPLLDTSSGIKRGEAPLKPLLYNLFPLPFKGEGD